MIRTGLPLHRGDFQAVLWVGWGAWPSDLAHSPDHQPDHEPRELEEATGKAGDQPSSSPFLEFLKRFMALQTLSPSEQFLGGSNVLGKSFGFGARKTWL